MLKKELRKHYNSKRLAIQKNQYWILNAAILNQLNQFNWFNFTYISIFLPIKSNNEIDTFELLNYLTQNYPHLKICLPKTNFNDFSMQHILYTNQTVLVKNKYNIPEPLYGYLILPAQIDVIFVPLLAFDKQGNRVGYGKGFYDRFLANCNSSSVKIGLSFFDAVEYIDDVDTFDIKLTNCVTPQKIYTF